MPNVVDGATMEDLPAPALAHSPHAPCESALLGRPPKATSMVCQVNAELSGTPDNYGRRRREGRSYKEPVLFFF